jgi:hypothetical protein
VCIKVCKRVQVARATLSSSWTHASDVKAVTIYQRSGNCPHSVGQLPRADSLYCFYRRQAIGANEPISCNVAPFKRGDDFHVFLTHFALCANRLYRRSGHHPSATEFFQNF